MKSTWTKKHQHKKRKENKMAAHLPRDAAYGFQVPPKTDIRRTIWEDPRGVTGKIELDATRKQCGDEPARIAEGIVEPVFSSFETFGVEVMKIQADELNPTDKGKQKAIAESPEFATASTACKKAEAAKAAFGDQVSETDKIFLKTGEIKCEEAEARRIEQALAGNDDDPVKRELMYMDSHERYMNMLPSEEKSVLGATISVMENRVIFNKQATRVDPFVPKELVKEMRTKRGRLQMVKAAKVRDEKARIASTIGSVTTLVRQRLEKLVPDSSEIQRIL